MLDSKRLQPNDKEVAAKVIDGEAILINLSNGIYYSMDKVGGWIWEMIDAKSSLDEIVGSIHARYDVTREQAEADVERLTKELVHENLVSEADSEAPASNRVEYNSEQRLVYESPQLNIYRDMGDLLAMDPPVPGLAEMNWKEVGD